MAKNDLVFVSGLPHLEEGELDLEELPGPPCQMFTDGVICTHKVLGLDGHPYYVFTLPKYNAKGDLVSLLWRNPDTQRMNKFVFE